MLKKLLCVTAMNVILGVNGTSPRIEETIPAIPAIHTLGGTQITTHNLAVFMQNRWVNYNKCYAEIDDQLKIAHYPDENGDSIYCGLIKEGSHFQILHSSNIQGKITPMEESIKQHLAQLIPAYEEQINTAIALEDEALIEWLTDQDNKPFPTSRSFHRTDILMDVPVEDLNATIDLIQLCVDTFVTPQLSFDHNQDKKRVKIIHEFSDRRIDQTRIDTIRCSMRYSSPIQKQIGKRNKVSYHFDRSIQFRIIVD